MVKVCKKTHDEHVTQSHESGDSVDEEFYDFQKEDHLPQEQILRLNDAVNNICELSYLSNGNALSNGVVEDTSISGEVSRQKSNDLLNDKVSFAKIINTLAIISDERPHSEESGVKSGNINIKSIEQINKNEQVPLDDTKKIVSENLDAVNGDMCSLTSSGFSSNAASNTSSEYLVPSSDFSSLGTNYSTPSFFQGSSNANTDETELPCFITTSSVIAGNEVQDANVSKCKDAIVNCSPFDLPKTIDNTPITEEISDLTTPANAPTRDSKTPSPTSPPSPYSSNYTAIESSCRSQSTSPVDLRCHPHSLFSFYSAPPSLDCHSIATENIIHQSSSSGEIENCKSEKQSTKLCRECMKIDRNSLDKSCKSCSLLKRTSQRSSTNKHLFTPCVGRVRSGLNCTDLNYNLTDFELLRASNGKLTDSVISIENDDVRETHTAEEPIKHDEEQYANSIVSVSKEMPDDSCVKLKVADSNSSDVPTHRSFLSRLSFPSFSFGTKSYAPKEKVDPSQIECHMNDGKYSLRKLSIDLDLPVNSVEKDPKEIITPGSQLSSNCVDKVIKLSNQRSSTNCSTSSESTKDSDYYYNSSSLSSPVSEVFPDKPLSPPPQSSAENMIFCSPTSPNIPFKSILKPIPELPRSGIMVGSASSPKPVAARPSSLHVFDASSNSTFTPTPLSLIFLDTLNMNTGKYAR